MSEEDKTGSTKDAEEDPAAEDNTGNLSSGGAASDVTEEATEDRTTADATKGVSVESGKVTEPEQTWEPARALDEPMALTDSWEEIATAGADGTYKEKYRIGDTRELDMGPEGVVTMRLVAMDADELADGSGKAPMTWIADELLKSEFYINGDLRP